MNRSTRTLVVLGVAVLAAAAASYGVYVAIRSIPERRVEIATRYAVVAKTALPIGEKLTPELVKLVPWPEQNPLKGGFTDVTQVVNRGLISAVDENEPLTERKLAPKEAGAGLPPTIAPGMRAVSIRVNDVIGVAGFVVPGTRVDVLTTFPGGEGTRVVVSNVQVLTANTRYDQEDAKQGKAIRSTVATLMVSPLDAERITLAQTEGQLMLTLRNPLDVEPTDSRGVTRASLFGGAPAPAPAPARAAARRVVAPELPPVPIVLPKPYLVETIRAAKRTEETLK